MKSVSFYSKGTEIFTLDDFELKQLPIVDVKFIEEDDEIIPRYKVGSEIHFSMKNHDEIFTTKEELKNKVLSLFND